MRDPMMTPAMASRCGWAEVTTTNYFDRITEPVLMFHGTSDESCPVAWARQTKRALDAAA